MRWDVLGNYTKDGPNGGAAPVNFNADNPENCNFWIDAWDLKWEGGTWRNINGNPAGGNDEADNYTMGQHKPPAICPIIERTTPISPQPIHPVTVDTFQDAYNSIVINEDVGALPHDSHAQRLVDAPENGDAYTTSILPPPFGSGSVAFNTFNVPTDTDNDGIPDSYETLIGTNPNVFENQAVLDSDGNGYMNIEDWAHSLVGIVASTTPPPPPSKPNPPTNVVVN